MGESEEVKRHFFSLLLPFLSTETRARVSAINTNTLALRPSQSGDI